MPSYLLSCYLARMSSAHGYKPIIFSLHLAAMGLSSVSPAVTTLMVAASNTVKSSVQSQLHLIGSV